MEAFDVTLPVRTIKTRTQALFKVIPVCPIDDTTKIQESSPSSPLCGPSFIKSLTIALRSFSGVPPVNVRTESPWHLNIYLGAVRAFVRGCIR